MGDAGLNLYDAVVSGQDPTGSDDPFGDLGFLGDLARMLSNQSGGTWDAARQLAVTVATDGRSEPNVDPGARIALEQIARAAELRVAEATGLSTGGIDVVAVTRSMWASRSVDAYRPVLEHMRGAFSPPVDDTGDPAMAMMGSLFSAMGPMMLGLAAGSMVGHLARHSLGQYDLPLPRASRDLLLVPANIDEVVADWSLAADDLRMWVCVNEFASHVVLSVPHVHERFNKLLHDYAAAFEPDAGRLEEQLGGLDPTDPTALANLQERFGDPDVLFGAIISDRQRELLVPLTALVTTVVGYTDHITDEVGARMLTDPVRIAEALRRRRVEASSADRFVERLLGLDLTQDVYDRGRAFIDGVVERAGADALGSLWSEERFLPTPNEVDAPGLWLARIELPTD